MLHTCRSHTLCSPRARTKSERSKANEKGFSVSLVIPLMAGTPTPCTEQGKDHTRMHFSDTVYLLGLPHREIHSVPNPPHAAALVWAVGTGVGSQIILRDEGTLTKPALQVRFPKHLPTLLPLIIIADMFSCHGGLRTSFPGTNHTQGNVFAGECGLW